MAEVYTQFSEFECKQIGLKLNTKDTYLWDCIGEVSVTKDLVKVVKKCRGVVAKSRTREAGTGTIKVKAHWPIALLYALQGMNVSGLKTGVYASGDSCIHPEGCLTLLLEDEDGNLKYKAFPRVTLASEVEDAVTNGEEEVAEQELEFTYRKDDDGYGCYEALADQVDETTAGAWMKTFSTSLVKPSGDTAENPTEEGG